MERVVELYNGSYHFGDRLRTKEPLHVGRACGGAHMSCM